PNMEIDEEAIARGEKPVDPGPDPDEAATQFKKLKSLNRSAVRALEKYGRDHEKTEKALVKLAEHTRQFKLVPKVQHDMTLQMRLTMIEVRSIEREMMYICVKEAGMPRKDFVRQLPDNITNEAWLDKLIRAKRKYSSTIKQRKPDLVHLMDKIRDLEQESH